MILVIPYAFRLVTTINTELVITINRQIILILLIIIRVLVIPNIFSSVFKQLAQEREMNRVGIVTFFQNILSYRLAPYLHILYPPPNP